MKNTLKEMIVTVLQVGSIVLALRIFLIEPFYIPSGSMMPNLLIGDYILVTKYNYGYSKYSFPLADKSFIDFEGRIWEGKPERGDIAVFRTPVNTKIDYVKRVIGLPGDIIQVKKGFLYVNNEQVKRMEKEDFIAIESPIEPYIIPRFEEELEGLRYSILKDTNDGYMNNTQTYKVPENHYFMMGDNRDNSNDSRGDVGFVPVDNFIGKVALVLFSWDSNHSIINISRFIRWDRFVQLVQ